MRSLRSIPTAAQNPNAAAGTIAQMVQRSEYPDRYNQSEGKARQLIDRARQLVGGNPPPTGACRQNYTVANGMYLVPVFLRWRWH